VTVSQPTAKSEGGDDEEAATDAEHAGEEADHQTGSDGLGQAAAPVDAVRRCGGRPGPASGPQKLPNPSVGNTTTGN